MPQTSCLHQPGRSLLLLGILLLGILLRWPPAAGAEDPPEPPQVLMCAPLGGLPGETIQVKARGLRLEGTTEVRCETEGVEVKFLSDSNVGTPPGLNADRAGDTQVEFELTLADGVAASEAELVFIAPHGEARYRLPLEGGARTIQEVEPNPGYQQAQEIELPQLVLGQIEQARDVDVYAVELAAGERVHIEVAAERFGSAMDPLVTLADSQTTPLATNDDHGGTRDARIEIEVPATGRYFVIVQDANDGGGAAHPYRLSLATLEAPISFVGQIAPILQQRCVACHGARTSEGGYRVDTYNHLLESGDSGEPGFAAHDLEVSESFRRIASEDPGERMPAEGEPLPADEIALIRTWLEQGARFDGTDPEAPLIAQLSPITHPKAPLRYAAPLPISALAFSPDGKELLVGGYHEITVWDAEEGKLLRRIDQVAERTYAIAVHPSGERFAVAGGTPGQWGEVRLFSMSGQLLQVLAVSSDAIHDVAFSPAGDRLAVGRSDGSLLVYDLEQEALQLEITSHLDWVLAVAWNADGTKLASASRDKTAKVYDAESGQLLASYTRHNGPVRGVLFHPSGEEVYSSAEGRWDRWKIADAERVRDMHLGAEPFKLLGLGDFFLVPTANSRVQVIKAEPSDRERELHDAGDRRLLSVAGHASADRVAAGSHGGEVVFWQLSTGERLGEFVAVPE